RQNRIDKSDRMPGGKGAIRLQRCGSGRRGRGRRTLSSTHSIVLCGDTSLGDWYLKRAPAEVRRRLSGEPMEFFAGISQMVRGADSLVVNLETVLWKDPKSPFEGKKPYL